MSAGREWPYEEWCRYYRDHPVTGTLVRGLIREFQDEGGEWRAVAPAAEPAGRPERVRLWHPIRASAEDIGEWRERIVAERLRQPFKQAFREIYLLTPARRRPVSTPTGSPPTSSTTSSSTRCSRNAAGRPTSSAGTTAATTVRRGPSSATASGGPVSTTSPPRTTTAATRPSTPRRTRSASNGGTAGACVRYRWRRYLRWCSARRCGMWICLGCDVDRRRSRMGRPW
ncbi:DUF4132 domain-containing protein [Streptomyces sp. T1317-0309]|nr:DUF4132 domain-containing protein [Streptomyces sp. T1317-0309]